MDGFVQTALQLYSTTNKALLFILHVVFIVGCIHKWLPQQHRQTRSLKLPVSPETVWKIILDIDRYPSWRSHVISIQPQHSANAKTLCFIEQIAHTKQQLAYKRRSKTESPIPWKNTRARSVAMTRISNECLVRIDRGTRVKSAKDGTPLKAKLSTLQRTWEIAIRPDGYHTIFTLTETVHTQGMLARWLGPVLGFHRASQRFLVDLVRELDRSVILSTQIKTSPAPQHPLKH
ncbi:uncharacterized protein BYT42DRAFT_560659 [Radiomyces spectabilis]|uniref:uncharacterized protein n=1 Tax=Radiomyces spectabilis TaxID=64574 RepID=UPI0022205815|nr:uncharacterized protein BYT42DRAFT_560659 [Radiomyces spectabilis]KAI8388603.1 hypothetical protein BYT42DRAFT_560659 [Radiomyces spectabilis]